MEDATKPEAQMTLLEWAIKWGVNPVALRELGTTCMYLGRSDDDIISEAALQRDIRLEAAQKDKLLFRNNRGAGRMESGNFVRYGLANDSKKLGDEVKSADLVGIERVLITPDHVGSYLGRFLSVEVKTADWKYTGTKEELAQVKWATAVNNYGGRALITNRLGVL